MSGWMQIIKMVSKSSPDQTYPAYVVGDSDSISEMTQVAAVTRPRSGPDQLEDLLRQLLLTVDPPAPIPEVPPVEKLLQCLVTETQSRPSPVVSPPAAAGLEQMLRSFLSGQQPTRQPPRPWPARRDWNDVVCFSCGKSGHAVTRCPNLDESFCLCSRDVGWRRLRGGGGGGVHYDPTSGVARPTADGKRRLIWGEGFASQVSSTVRPQDPGGGATPVAAPRLMKTDDISDRWGGGLQWFPPESRWCWSRRPRLGTPQDWSVHVTIKRGSP